MVRLLTSQKGWWRHPPCFTGSGGLGSESFIPKLKGFACFLLGVQWGHQGQSETGPRRPSLEEMGTALSQPLGPIPQALLAAV